MKKYLRGKRYIRSQSSVQAGRFRKQIRKLKRFTRIMNVLVEIMKSPSFIEGVIDAVRNIENAARELIRKEIIRRQVRRWN